MSMHIASLVKIPGYLLRLSTGNENMGVSRADNLKNLTKFAQISLMLIYIHVVSLVKIPCYLLKLSSGNENMDEICPIAIPNQISTILMHIPSLVKIH